MTIDGLTPEQYAKHLLECAVDYEDARQTLATQTRANFLCISDSLMCERHEFYRGVYTHLKAQGQGEQS